MENEIDNKRERERERERERKRQRHRERGFIHVQLDIFCSSSLRRF